MSPASAIVGLLLLLLFAAPVAFYFLKIKPDLQRMDDERYPERREMRERDKKLSAILDRSRVIGFDCEGFENASDYEHLARKLLGSVHPVVGVTFTCTVEDNKKKLEVAVGSERFVRRVDHDTDWVDLTALLQLLNRALKVAGATGKLTRVELTSDQGAHVVYASEDERKKLRSAKLFEHF
jgi:hypothetical protein